MKKLLRQTIAFSFFFTGALAASAQAGKQEESPRWVSDKGYWVVESNRATPKEHIVYFYTNNDVLAYKEQVSGRHINVHRVKTRLDLKAALEEAVALYEAGRAVTATKLVAHRINR